MSFQQLDKNSPGAEWYRTFTQKWPKPSAIVIISAHWETRGAVHVTTAPRHPLLFDYYGFPKYTYDLEYPCRGNPALADRILTMLEAGGVKAKRDETRGYDHGVFIPLKLMYPQADIPVVQVNKGWGTRDGVGCLRFCVNVVKKKQTLQPKQLLFITDNMFQLLVLARYVYTSSMYCLVSCLVIV